MRNVPIRFFLRFFLLVVAFVPRAFADDEQKSVQSIKPTFEYSWKPNQYRRTSLGMAYSGIIDTELLFHQMNNPLFGNDNKSTLSEVGVGKSYDWENILLLNGRLALLGGTKQVLGGLLSGQAHL